MRTIYIECNMGAAGDMLMAALYELLDDKEGFLETMNHLGLPGVRVLAEEKTTCGIAGTHMKVTVHGEEEMDHHHGSEGSHEHGTHQGHGAHHDHGEHHHHAHPGHIYSLIDGLPLPEEVIRNAKEVYRAIADAEAKAHGCPVEEVHFHEVGALDAVADVAGVCLAMHLLAPDRVIVSPVHVGSGTVRCAHGVMPVPAPATAALLAGVPVSAGDVEGELCTPTGAALLVHFADGFGSMPSMVLEKTGIGVGTKEFVQANCVRIFSGTPADEGQTEDAAGRIAELVCNIDDMTPEALAFACESLLRGGALDVYTVPGTMKKGRAGFVLTVLCSPERVKETAAAVLRETTTNGLRVRYCDKYYLIPGMEQTETSYGTVRIKRAQGYGVSHVKPEYDDVARLAREAGVPYREVFGEAEDLLRKSSREGRMK